MSGLVAEFEMLAATMRRRGWIARAAVVNEASGVVSMCASSTPPVAPEMAQTPDPGELPQGTVAHLAIVGLDTEQWVYVDLGPLRWMARLEKGHDEARIESWLTLELQKLGVTVERDLAAQE